MITAGTRISVQNWWAGEWRGPTVFTVGDGQLHPGQPAAPAGREPAQLHIPGTLFPALVDRHVHLGLIDREALLPHGITHALDLGWVPEQAALWGVDSAEAGSQLPETSFVGAFLTAPGGYPSRTAWAPPGSAIELASAEEARAAVAAQCEIGAWAIKLMLNSAAGPMPSDPVAVAVYEAAAEGNMPLIVHAEGAGGAQLAADLGADALAHAPFSERLSTRLLDEMALMGMQWISTLDIHGWGEPTPQRAIAIDNVRRYLARGGRVVYGTDLGNGPLPAGVNERELLALVEAGMGADALVAAIAGTEPHPRIGPRIAWVRGDPPSATAGSGSGAAPRALAEQTARWLAGARGTTIDYLEETLP